MQINYKPGDGWAADFIPFYWQGAYHLFYLKDYRDPAGHGEGTPWFHLVTRDFLHFEELGECLPRGSQDEQDLYVFTGSALQAEGQFHIFYTGHNPHRRRAGQPEQAILHAVSADLRSWHKLPEERFFAPAEGYEPHDWRDPFVFWNEEAREYWMLAAARLTQGPPRRRGCTALCASPDLRTWQVRAPFYAPGLYFTHECPDLFRIGDWWYLVFSEFSEASLTRYRMARSLSGPWLTPPDDAFDGRAFYAAKTAGDGSRRFLFGWNPTREGQTDHGAWQWGGSLAVHELVQRPDGTLAACLPPEVAAAFTQPQPIHWQAALACPMPAGDTVRLDRPAGYSALLAGDLPAQPCRLDATLRFDAPTQSLGLLLRASPDFETGYALRLEPARNRLVLDSWPRPGDRPHWQELERPLQLIPGQDISLTLYLNGTLCEVYLDGQVAMSARFYDHPAGAWGLFVSQGAAQFSRLALSTPSEAL